MSRAFVKENDLEHAGIDIPERPVSKSPNYVTNCGLEQLLSKAKDLEQDIENLVNTKNNPEENNLEGKVKNKKYQKKNNDVKNEKIKKSLIELTKVFKEK